MTGPGFPIERPRRLRRTPALRRLVAETRLSPADLVLPLFVKEGLTEPVPVAAMPGVVQHTRDSLRKAAHEAVEAGVGGLILFGIPADKDEVGSQADDPDGIVQVALRDLTADLGDATVVMADLCLCEYTDHGHCGPLTDVRRGRQRSDARAVRLRRGRPGPGGCCSDRAVGHAGRPGRGDPRRPRRRRLRRSARSWPMPPSTPPPSTARSARPPSRRPRPAIVGPTRWTRRTRAEALREVALDLAEGADAVMVKPAGPYLDVRASGARRGRRAGVRLPGVG